MTLHFTQEITYSKIETGDKIGHNSNQKQYSPDPFPQMALYKDPKLSDKEMTAVYNEARHAYWVIIEPGDKAVYMLLDNMNLENLQPHPENPYFLQKNL
jgi:hypothetical protein